MGIDYKIISTGSQGNAVVINNTILIDCGVHFKALREHYKSLKLVLLTHVHRDHFNYVGIRTLARKRPSLRFGCGRWMIEALLKQGVPASNIDVLAHSKCHNYGSFQVIPKLLTHSVPNQGYKLRFADGSKMIYATDTGDLDGISAPDYDLYLIEANHEEAEIQERIARKKAEGVYAYEVKVVKNHLSKEKADSFILENIGAKGIYQYLHCHQDKENAPC